MSRNWIWYSYSLLCTQICLTLIWYIHKCTPVRSYLGKQMTPATTNSRSLRITLSHFCTSWAIASMFSIISSELYRLFSNIICYRHYCQQNKTSNKNMFIRFIWQFPKKEHEEKNHLCADRFCNILNKWDK